MPKALFTVNLGQVTLKFSSLSDAHKVCSAKPEVRVEGERKRDRVSFKVRLSDNILNHILVLSRVNYTFGFPLELAKGVSLNKLAKINSSGLREDWWFLSASILASEVNSLEELLEAIDELEAFIHEGTKPSKLRLALTEEWYEEAAKVYPDASTWEKRLAELRENLDRETLKLLRDSIKECYDTFYAKYWRKRERQLLDLSKELKRAVDVLQPLRKVEEIVKMKFPYDALEVFLVDIFRNGGGIYGVPPKRIINISGECAPLLVHLAIAHEAGHLLVSDWRIKLAEEVKELAREMKVNKPLALAGLIEEHVVALLQLKADEHYYGEHRVTHGFMENETFRVAEVVWSKSKEELGTSWDFVKYMRELLKELKRSKRVIKELTKLLNEEYGPNSSDCMCLIGYPRRFWNVFH